MPNIEISKKKYLKKIFWLDYIVAVPTLLRAALDEKDPFEKMKNLPNNLLTEEFIKKELGIEYDLDLFRFNCIIQCFLYREKVDRCDSTNKKMLITDLFYNNHFDKVIKKYVKKIFNEELQKDKNKKIKDEINILKDEIVKQLLDTDSIDNFINILNQGIKKGTVELKILNFNSIGFIDLINNLLDKKINHPLKQEKVFILITGRNENCDIVWNQGNMFRNKDIIQKAKELFDGLDEKLVKMNKNFGIHIYRGGADKCNRHGHSNDLPSYWAYGYQSISEMEVYETKEFLKDYYQNHIGCCGLGKDGLSYTKMKKKKKKEGSIGGASYNSGS